MEKPVNEFIMHDNLAKFLDDTCIIDVVVFCEENKPFLEFKGLHPRQVGYCTEKKNVRISTLDELQEFSGIPFYVKIRRI